MTIAFYTFSKREKSTKQPATAALTIDAKTNTDFDVLHPSIPLVWSGTTPPTAYNYCYIPEFGRYYFVSWHYAEDMWWADCDVDPLASWKTEIGNTSAYVLRAAGDYDPLIIDELYPMKTSEIYQNDIASASWWDENPQNGTFVVGIAGSGATNYYYFTYNMLGLLLRYLFGLYYDDVLTTLTLAIHPELKLQVNPLQYISSIIWLPFRMIGTSYASELFVGEVDIVAAANIPAWPVTAADGVVTFTRTYTIQRHPQTAAWGEWVNVRAATYKLFCPPFGNLELDPVLMANNSVLTVMIQVDTRTGYSILRVHAGTPADPFNYLMINVTGQVGIPYQIGQVQAPGIGVGALLPTMMSAVSGIATGVALGGPAGAAMGAASALGAAFSAVGDVAKYKVPTSNTVGGTPCVASLKGLEKVEYIWRTVVNQDPTDRGRPLCQTRTLNTLPGYQLIAAMDLEIPCTPEERTAIENALTSGYFYE